MKTLALIIILILLSAFNFNENIKKWELSEHKVTAFDLHLRDQILIQQKICKMEFNIETFPGGCFRLLTLLDKLKVKYDKRFYLQTINNLCIETAKTITKIESIESVIKNTKANSACIRALKKRKSILIYKQEN